MKLGLQIDVTVLRLARSFLNAPNVKQYAGKMATDYGMKPWKTREALVRMERFGWLTSYVERADRSMIGREPRRFYGLTPTGRDQASAVWKTLEST